MGSGKGNTELHRGQRNAPLKYSTIFIKLIDLAAALTVVGAAFQLLNKLVKNIIFDGLLIGRDIACIHTIEIQLSNI